MDALQMDARPFRFILAKTCAGVFGRKSYVVGPGKTVKLARVPDPALPGTDWVILRTIYCGFCGSDLNLIMLHDAPSAQPFSSFPSILGHEFVGEIIEAGRSVEGFKQGDTVAVNPVFGCKAREISPLCPECERGRVSNCRNQAEGRFSPGMFLGITKDLNGGFAPFVAVHQSQLFHIPDGLSPEAAVMTEPVAVALQAVFENKPSDGDHILVIGGGVIGNLIVQSIRALGITCHISVIEPSPFAGAHVLSAGADTLIRPDEALERGCGITGAKPYKPVIGQPVPRGGFATVYDTVGNSATLNTGLRLLETSGILSLVGIGSTLKIDPTTLWLKLQTIRGVFGYGMVDFDGRRMHAFEAAMNLMNQEKIRVMDLITHRFKLEDYRQMIHVNMNKNRFKAIKTIVTFGE